MAIKKCTNCGGSGKQIFHGSFESAMGNCNFCAGTGKREEQIKCLERITIKCSGQAGSAVFATDKTESLPAAD